MRLWTKGLLAVAAGLGGAVYWARRNPLPCPYSQRFFLGPRPFITRSRLGEVLRPQAGERLLELGPGTGFYTLAVARGIAPGGVLEICDVQQEMLDHTKREADRAGIGNVVPTRADARELPYSDASFDGAFLVTVLGEVPDQDRALEELARVLKPGARLVVGEIAFDPHFVTLNSLWKRCERAGFVFEEKSGNAVAYFARFRNPAIPQAGVPASPLR
jgi:ubiquinone/menaquinone biosynthesis C-methylase UbiE